MEKSQLQELQEQLTEVQKYCKQMATIGRTDPMSTMFTRWSNIIGTTRVLLDVFADEWAEKLALKTVPRNTGGSPGAIPRDDHGKTSATCNDFDDSDH